MYVSLVMFVYQRVASNASFSLTALMLIVFVAGLLHQMVETLAWPLIFSKRMVKKTLRVTQNHGMLMDVTQNL